ncbi:hypothetical protein MATL_G00167300 [Megalops atlanticus]|uniref:SPRY domain-containing SOCS box protein 1 n=1 Tax=Megalops atlanticus TaxID=7932 RepID=A0A9D3PN75_MEGAT|nr:hypothetical protein MATL_G00167300 [Megalops atlanticus]
MGLTLCRWLSRDCHRRNRYPYGQSSSPFTPFAVTPASRLAVLLDTPPAPPADPRSSWSPAHHSPNFTLSRDGTVAERAPAEQSTDGVRGAEGERAGLHVWEVRWDPAERGSHAAVGVSTHRCPRQASGYTALVGGDIPQEGGMARRGGVRTTPLLPVPARVLMVLDGDAGTLGFVVDGCFLGVAVRDLPRGACLFPAVSSVWGGCRITLRYLNGAPREPPSLTSLCRLSIRQSMGKDRETQTDRLPLPPGLRRLLWNAAC